MRLLDRWGGALVFDMEGRRVARESGEGSVEIGESLDRWGRILVCDVEDVRF